MWSPRTILPLLVLLSNVNLAFTMASGSASLVSKFASKPFIQRALQNPSSPESVLSFFFGVDYSNKTHVESQIHQGHCMDAMKGLWFGGGPEYDELCQPFRDVVRAAGSLPRDPWATTVDGKMAQLLLRDQISRQLFRGTPEAFAYDAPALENARTLAQAVLSKDKDNDACPPVDTDLAGEFYAPHLSFMVVACMHSEMADDHALAMKLIEYAKANTPAHLSGWWKFQTQHELEHKTVVDRFGRYPHRNAAKGRTSTPEELEWLADKENLPGWAKSQM
jgi:uncharacterized protein (DUF924 family)